jgi:type IV secretory pathway TrbL component
MFERFSRNTVVATGAALLAALGIGTAAVAQSNGSSSKPSQQSAPAQPTASETPGVESNAPENSATDPDNVQYTAPGDKDAKSGTAKATAAASGAPEAPGTEQAPGSEAPGAPETPASETGPSDGPGGHADEPGNPTADHQFQGVQ